MYTHKLIYNLLTIDLRLTFQPKKCIHNNSYCNTIIVFVIHKLIYNLLTIDLDINLYGLFTYSNPEINLYTLLTYYS